MDQLLFYGTLPWEKAEGYADWYLATIGISHFDARDYVHDRMVDRKRNPPKKPWNDALTYLSIRGFCIDWLRSPRNAKTEPVKDMPQNPILEQIDQIEILAKAISRLTREQKQLVRLRFFEGKTIAEIAEELGVAKSTASEKIAKLLLDLKVKFKVLSSA